VKRFSPPSFPDWLPKAVRQQAKELWKKLPTEKDPAKAQQVLEQLIANPLMKRVWDELYRKMRMPRNTAPTLWALRHKVFFNPACLTNASKAAALREKAQELRKKGDEENIEDARFLDFEARVIQSLPEDPIPAEWTEQDRAAQLFFTRAYRIALDCDPQIVSDQQAKVGKLQKIAERLRESAKELKSVDSYVFSYYAKKLEKVASDCDDDAKVMRPNLANSPWLVPRKRGDLRQKTIVAKLAYTTLNLFSKILPSTIANVTNVICHCDHTGSGSVQRPVRKMTRDKIRKMIEPNALTIRPSFGPQVYPVVQARAGTQRNTGSDTKDK
jgi:hypothetical protein